MISFVVIGEQLETHNMQNSILRRSLPRIRSCRAFSTGELIKVEVNDKSGVAIVTLNRPPVNGISVDFLHSLKKTVGNLEANKCRGLILTSVSFLTSR